MKKISKGFSLLEIMISVAVSAVIFPAVISLMSLSTYTTSQGEAFTQAGVIAEKEMESYYSLKNSSGYDSITAGGSVCSTEGIFNKCKTVTLVGTDEKKINISVTWNDRGTTQSVNLETIIANI